MVGSRYGFSFGVSVSLAVKCGVHVWLLLPAIRILHPDVFMP